MPQRKPRKRAVVLQHRPPDYPWERQPEETDAAWAGFVTYRDLGPANRTLRQAAKNSGKSGPLFEEWSQRWDWVARCHEYDAFLDRKKREADVAAIEEMRRRHIDFSMALQGTAALALNKIMAAEKAPLLDKNDKPLKDKNGKPILAPLTLKPSEVRDLAELGVKLERLNRGEPDSIQQQKHELTVEDRRTALQRAAKNTSLRMAIRKALAAERGEDDERAGGSTKH